MFSSAVCKKYSAFLQSARELWLDILLIFVLYYNILNIKYYSCICTDAGDIFQAAERLFMIRRIE